MLGLGSTRYCRALPLPLSGTLITRNTNTDDMHPGKMTHICKHRTIQSHSNKQERFWLMWSIKSPQILMFLTFIWDWDWDGRNWGLLTNHLQFSPSSQERTCEGEWTINSSLHKTIKPVCSCQQPAFSCSGWLPHFSETILGSMQGSRLGVAF